MNVLSTQAEIERLDSDDCSRVGLYITTELIVQSQHIEDYNTAPSDTTCVMRAGSKLPKL